MRRLRLASGEEGIAMVMVIGMIVLLSVLAVALIDVMQGAPRGRRTSRRRSPSAPRRPFTAACASRSSSTIGCT